MLCACVRGECLVWIEEKGTTSEMWVTGYGTDTEDVTDGTVNYKRRRGKGTAINQFQVDVAPAFRWMGG